MKNRVRSFNLFCLPLLGLLLSSCTFTICQPARFKETREIPVAPVETTGLDVRAANGSITVRCSKEQVATVTAQLKCISQERLNATEIIVERGEDQTMKVYAVWPGGRRLNRESCSFEIVLPEVSGISLHSSNGALYCEGAGGVAELTTSNGRVEIVDHAGPVTVRTSNGKIEVRNIDGNCDLRTSNGAIEALNVEYPITAQSSNGRIVFELGPAFSGEVSASTSNGALDIGGLSNVSLISNSRNRIHFRVGDSSQASSASTSNGSIRIQPAR